MYKTPDGFLSHCLNSLIWCSEWLFWLEFVHDFVRLPWESYAVSSTDISVLSQNVFSCLTEQSSGSQQVDLFGQDLLGDFLDVPVSVPTDKSTSLDNDPSEVDLFADAAFVSAPPQPAADKNPEPQVKLSFYFSKRQGT